MNEFSWTIRQFEGYRKAIEDAGITLDMDLVLELKDFDMITSYNAMKEYLKKSLPFTAFIGLAEDVCTGVMKALKESNIRIPDDISVACLGPSMRLTEVSYDMAELGRMAVSRLIERIENPAVKPARTAIAARLIDRKTVRKIIP
jgi:DNA-binding LacI/PurR family transcriptional regulator